MRRPIALCLPAALLLTPALAAQDDERWKLRIAPVPLQHSQEVSAVTFTPDGRRVVTVSDDEGKVFLWDARSGRLLHQTRLPLGRLWGSAVSPDGKTVAARGVGDGVALWSPSTGERVRTLAGGAGSCLAFSPDGKSLVGATSGGLAVWDTATGKQRCKLPGSGLSFAQVAAFSADGRRVAAPRPDGSVGMWDAATGKELGAVDAATQDLRLLSFLPEGKTLATCDGTGLVRLWDTATKKERRQFQLPGGESVRAGQFSPDGRTLLTGGSDRTVWLWEVATGRPRHRFPGHEDWLRHLAFAPDGRTLVAVGKDHLALVREASGDAPTEFTRTVPPRAGKPGALWEDLAGNDAEAAYQAVTALAQRPAEAVALFKERLRPEAPRKRPGVARLIKDLDSPTFAGRERAMKELALLHEDAQPDLADALKANPPLEVRRRLEQLLARIRQEGLPPEQRRALRAVEALELAGTAEARRLLQTLAAGAAGERLTEEARAALTRLGGKAPTP